MTALKFIQKELNKCKINLSKQMERNAPEEVISNIQTKINHYEKICELLKREDIS